jgi:hypothetical protein
MDFWRFWVVHLWVEDFLELFTTIMVAYIFVLLGVVRPVTATRVVYLDVILYSVGGVIGTMHHLYFSGAPAIHMSLGAMFSAMEVIPLVLLTFEAWRFIRLGAYQTEGSMMWATSAAFPHKWAVMFLIAVGFWNFLGAGVFGFLINLPIVSYYEIGTQLTANCSATITLSLERQLEFPSKNQRRGGAVLWSVAQRSGTKRPPTPHAAGLPPPSLTLPRAAWPASPPPADSWRCSTPRSRCDAPGGRSPPPSSSGP